MSPTSAAIVAAAAALLSSALTGFISYKIAGREERRRDTEELRAALAGYGAVLDRITRHFDQMPHPPGPLGRGVDRVVSRWRDLDWALGRISTGILGRGLIRTLDELTVAMNRLLLIAPEGVLDAAQEISLLIERLEPHDETWKAEWRAARGSLARCSREAVPHL